MADGIGLGGVGGIGGLGSTPAKPAQETEKGDVSFKDVLFGKIDEVNSLQKEAEAAMSSFAAGKTENLSEMFIAVQKADLAFKTLMTIRNKLFDAYQEISQLRV